MAYGLQPTHEYVKFVRGTKVAFDALLNKPDDTLFFIYEIGMMIMYLYFFSIFCSIYQASQWNWFTNSIMSNLLSLLYTLGLSVIISVCRFIGLYCNSDTIYNISLYLNH